MHSIVGMYEYIQYVGVCLVPGVQPIVSNMWGCAHTSLNMKERAHIAQLNSSLQGRDSIFKRLRGPGIDSEESISSQPM